ncbi:MAG: polyprenyl synthetase family protein [Kiritimatiellae bacterium]|nr:polyprenyl synthetase family protein [Kiritimatiellia bacterium]
MERYLKIINDTLEEALLCVTRPAVLNDAMKHALLAGGKRIRPVIALAAAEAVGGDAIDAKYVSCAIELLHNYTLVHDDLPSMDNDTLRRGKPTVWAKYGESTAILAGDALQSLAFAMIAKTSEKRPGDLAKILNVFSEKALGVVCGQVEDLSRNEQSDYDFIYEHKTADLFVAAAQMGAIAGGGSEEDVNAIAEFALNLGLAFQYEDDLLDGDSPWGREETVRRVDETTSKACIALKRINGDTSFLSSLANKLIGRTF